MKSIDLKKEKVELTQLLHYAEKGPVLLVTADGHEFILSEADDFESEVEALRNSQEFQLFLDDRMKIQTKIPIEEIEKEVELELQTIRKKKTCRTRR